VERPPSDFDGFSDDEPSDDGGGDAGGAGFTSGAPSHDTSSGGDDNFEHPGSEQPDAGDGGSNYDKKVKPEPFEAEGYASTRKLFAK
jgi:hypothetical protein